MTETTRTALKTAMTAVLELHNDMVKANPDLLTEDQIERRLDEFADFMTIAIRAEVSEQIRVRQNVLKVSGKAQFPPLDVDL